jgi:hypothetical protein
VFAAAASSIEVDATADPRFDVETFVDRPRFMGLDRGLVDEADRRLRADPRSGMNWLLERLKELGPRRRLPA